MDDILELADRLWTGETEVSSAHPLAVNGGLSEVAPRTAYVASFARVSAFSTDDGLVLVDTGHELAARAIHAAVRAWDTGRLNTAVFSHGHIDHVFGVTVFESEAAEAGWPAPVVVAHEALPARFDRYKMTAGYNAAVNRRQFQVPSLEWPTEYRYPDRTYRDRLELDVGGERFELHHARGETDDHTWTYVPGRKVLCPGDLFIWCSPNAGNPQKVQRYPLEWARALREMATLDVELMLPGHGFPVLGAARVRRALSETAELLESLVSQSLDLMNAGARLDDLLHGVVPPAHLMDRPYLKPVYDEPEFVVRNIWRLYGGWYDGNPANLQPAPEAALAAELAALSGGARRLAGRALELLGAGELRLAGHLAELAALAAPGDRETAEARASVFAARAEQATSTMAKGIFSYAAGESQKRADEAG
ncbi:MAG TPA: alkyl sulfatase dimerization domain-containing protein [Acidimicrobiales bacterium]|nr:alkyl sulfatase dimerization domain-containing protein [Acidimicrobiales bacterium]